MQMKKIITCLFLIAIIGAVLYYRNNITNYVTNEVILPIEKKGKPVDITYNSYKYGDWQIVKNTTDFNAKKYEDFDNIFYTILNSGVDEFTFYCSKEYESCVQDVQTYVNSDQNLGNINNLIHPYNSFKNIQVTVTNYGKITIKVNHIYTKEQIDYVNSQIENFIKNNINTSMSDQDKIKAFHDYIANNTRYDQSVKTVEDKLALSSYNAYGLLVNHKAICGGYTDALAIYLNMLGYTNYRVATNEHIWNLVNINGTYYHIDLTWDDPVTSNGSDQLLHDYFLISNATLHQKDPNEHNFNANFYLEAN